MIDYIDGILLQTSCTSSNSNSNCFNSFVFASRFRMPCKMIAGKLRKEKNWKKKEEKKSKEINSYQWSSQE